MTAFNEPTQWTHTLGNLADVNDLPEDATGAASLQKIFPLISQVPLPAGGVAPARKDFNALFKVLGDNIFYGMQGGLASYNAAYDYVVGRVVVYAGKLYVCIAPNGASSTPALPTDEAHWTQIGKQIPSIPTGSLVPFAGRTIPDGYLLCNGANVSRTVYAGLFAVIGTIYGAGNGSTTFTLPNFVDRFIEGTGTASAVGQYLEAGLPNITGSIGNFYVPTVSVGGAFTATKIAQARPNTSTLDGSYDFALDASRSSAIYGSSTTVQPSAVRSYILIKI